MNDRIRVCPVSRPTIYRRGSSRIPGQDSVDEQGTILEALFAHFSGRKLEIQLRTPHRQVAVRRVPDWKIGRLPTLRWVML